MAQSRILNDAQLSREKPGSVKWLISSALPPFVTYLRELLWTEDFSPCVRALYRAEAVCHTVCRDTNRALRLYYLTDAPDDGIALIPPPDLHGGNIVLASSVRPCSPAELYVPPVDAVTLNKWLARRENGISAYWRKWAKRHKSKPANAPIYPPAKPGFIARLFGGGA